LKPLAIKSCHERRETVAMCTLLAETLTPVFFGFRASASLEKCALNGFAKSFPCCANILRVCVHQLSGGAGQLLAELRWYFLIRRKCPQPADCQVAAGVVCCSSGYLGKSCDAPILGRQMLDLLIQ